MEFVLKTLEWVIPLIIREIALHHADKSHGDHVEIAKKMINEGLVNCEPPVFPQD